MKKQFLLLAVLLLVLVSACSVDSQVGGSGEPAGEQVPTAELAASQSPSPTITATSVPTQIPLPSPTPIVVLPPDPMLIEFQAEDGQELTGFYYPAGENPAPVIVLMHWARGDQSEWDPIARWLQGRGLLARDPDYNRSWKSADRYPERTFDIPLSVFTFNFRNCQERCQTYQPAEWLLDARAAVSTAAALQGADPQQILTAGASIGADGAVDSCAWLNDHGPGTCLGSFALSPASLLTEPFDEAALRLLPEAPVYCLYGLRDDASVETCQSLAEVTAVDYGYIENHGMELILSGRTPDPLTVIQEFIRDTLGEGQ